VEGLSKIPPTESKRNTIRYGSRKALIPTTSENPERQFKTMESLGKKLVPLTSMVFSFHALGLKPPSFGRGSF